MATIPVQSLVRLRVNLVEDQRQGDGLLSVVCESLTMQIETSSDSAAQGASG